jgi:hypothetical protein
MAHSPTNVPRRSSAAFRIDWSICLILSHG